jgi:1,2-diacylglycerol-3-alpha-glucose alpha-1,2-galactosyltransferase
MQNQKITIRMLSSATSVSGQGVGSAYMEQVELVKEQSDLFNVLEGKEKGGAEIYHVHTVNPTYRLRMTSRHVNVIYVHFLPQTLDGSLHMNKLNFTVFKHYVIHTYRKADEIVVVNPIFIEPLVKLGMKRENITYIPNYVSKENFHKLEPAEILALRKEYGIDPKAFVIMGCGQVQTRKGVKDYIQVAKDNPDITFVWAGGFSFGKMTDGYDELKAIMDNPPKNVKFIGIIERTKMNAIFNMCDVLFMPSFDELFPMSILEAANSAKPILLRDLELYKGILWDNYDSAHDVKGFDEEVRKLANDPAYYAHYSEKSTNIATFYSKEHVGELWREYYPRILAKWKDKKHIKGLK